MRDFDLFSMFMLGVLGTGHCIGMCGPLILAFPARTGKLAPHLWYHLGRVLTYVVIGGLMGGFGAGLAGIASAAGGDYLVWIARIQIGFSLLAALFLIIFGSSRLNIISEPSWLSFASPDKIPGYRKALKSAVVQNGRIELLFLGLLMGFLPCGLSFAAFARALPTGTPIKGAVLVLAFAVGTLPGLLLLGAGASEIVRRYRKPSDIFAGLLMFYMAIRLALKNIPAIFS